MRRIIHHPIIRKHAPQFLRFVACGIGGMTLDLTTVTILVRSVGISGYFATIPSSMVGASFVFVANKFFTFRNHQKKLGNQLFKFILVYGVAIVLNVLLSWVFLWLLLTFVFAEHLHLEATLGAKILAISIVALWNYVLSHGFIFRKGEDVDVAIV